jgi:hypothetical protein
MEHPINTPIIWQIGVHINEPTMNPIKPPILQPRLNGSETKAFESCIICFSDRSNSL